MVLWHHLPTNPCAIDACQYAISSQRSFVVVADAIATAMREETS